MEDKYFFLFREEIFLRHVSPFSRENSLPWFCVVILRREILKLFTTKRHRFNPALCNNSAKIPFGTDIILQRLFNSRQFPSRVSPRTLN